MTEVTLNLKPDAPTQPIDLRHVSPDVFAGKTLDEIRNIEIWIGNTKSNIGSIFEVSGESSPTPEEITLVVEGELPNSRRIGAKMTNGNIILNGKSGLYVGTEMKGGKIIVNGDVGEWVGIGMKKGLIEVEGNAGDFAGASYRGTREGMKGGLIVIKGNSGIEIGAWMKGGTIKVMGNVPHSPGIHMIGGSILIFGDCQSRVGASMTGGKVVLVGKTEDVLAGFQIEEIKDKVKVDEEKIPGPFYSFSGDHAEEGKGKIFIHKENNSYLSSYEIYL